MENRFYATLAAVLLTGTMLSSAAMAQDTGTTIPTPPSTTGASVPPNSAVVPDPGHPRINEVDQRLQNQQNRINAGVADGQINQQQETRDENRLQNQEQQLNKDEATDGGHITKAEQNNLNNGLNKNGQDIYNQRDGIPGHPRVNQVDYRDQKQQNRIDKGEADGQLSKAQATRDQAHLDHEEAVQKNQEAHDGGHLTKAEQRRDNKAMNRSSRKIHNQRHPHKNK